MLMQNKCKAIYPHSFLPSSLDLDVNLLRCLILVSSLEVHYAILLMHFSVSRKEFIHAGDDNGVCYYSLLQYR